MGLQAVGGDGAVLGMFALAFALLFALTVAHYRMARRQTARYADIERELRRSEQELQRNAQLLDTTLAYMDQGLMMIDNAGIIVVANARVRDLLGLPADLEITNRPFDDLVQRQWDNHEFARADITMVEHLQMGGIKRSPPIYERPRPNGVTLEIRTTVLEDGGYVRTYTDITARRAAEGSLRRQAATDDLTGLANRLTFRRRLSSAVEQSAGNRQTFAVFYMDLDRFKAINDRWGHEVGDRILVAVAERLRAHTRAADTVARLGGDEFAMITMLAEPPAEVQALAERIIASVASPYTLDGQVLEVGMSIGIAIQQAGACSADQLLRRADFALYEAKRAGGAGHHVYLPDLEEMGDQALAER
jgi:diguanylate cyclase (GGDEF)-like protein